MAIINAYCPECQTWLVAKVAKGRLGPTDTGMELVDEDDWQPR